MKLLLSRLLLTSLCAVSSHGVSSGTLVTQTADVSVMEGEAVNITCCWTGEFVRMTATWLKNQTNIKSENFATTPSQSSLQEGRRDCLDLIFKNITREGSGNYTCKLFVEIPELAVFEGKGTVITVTARDNTEDNTDPPITGGSQWEEVFTHYVLRCLPILALVTTFFCLNKLLTKAQQRTSAAPGNKLPSAQRIEENQEEERDERETEAE